MYRTLVQSRDFREHSHSWPVAPITMFGALCLRMVSRRKRASSYMYKKKNLQIQTLDFERYIQRLTSRCVSWLNSTLGRSFYMILQAPRVLDRCEMWVSASLNTSDCVGRSKRVLQLRSIRLNVASVIVSVWIFSLCSKHLRCTTRAVR
jgi:hypothetical protein